MPIRRPPARRLRLDALEDRAVPSAGHVAAEIRIDDAGREYCVIPPPDPDLLPPDEPPPARGPRDDTDPLQLHSRPGANRVIYLDFDGHTTTGTSWNNAANPTIVTPAYSLDGNPAFSTTELQRIRATWERVAEDYSPFDVDVTTQDPGVANLINSGGGDTQWGMRVLIGGNGAWAGSPGGVAFIGSFNWGTDTGCFVFEDNLGGTDKNMAEAASHEVGHTLGLGHDGRTSPAEGYYGGHGSGDTGWAPLMGVGYYQTLSQWSKGEYANANNTQDDLAIIARPGPNFGYRPDDAGNTVATATPFPGSGLSLAFAGVIERTTDVDVLAFAAGAGPMTARVDNHFFAPDLDVRLELWDAAGNLMWADNPVDLTDAEIALDLPAAGLYHLAVQGVGMGNPLTTGYSDYASLGQYTVTLTVSAPTDLSGLESAPLSYVEGNPGLPLTATAAVASAVNLQSATVAVSAGYVAGQDTLTFTPVGSITGSFSPATGVLTLTGAGTAAQYTTALRSVRYRNTSDDPNPQARTFTFRVTNIAGGSPPALSRDMTLTPVNDAPTLDPITDRLVNEDAGSQSVPLTGVSAGGEPQPVTIAVASSDPDLVPVPTLTYAGGPTGSLTFTPAADRSGTATITVTLTDPGGTANGGVDTRVRQFVVTVRSVNDAPAFEPGADPYAARDAGPQTLAGWAARVSPGPADEAGQALTVLIDNDNPALFAAPPALAADGTLTFTAAPGATGLAAVTVRLRDDGGTADGGADTSPPVTFYVFVGLNRAPRLDPAADAELFPVGEGATGPNGTPVAAFALAGYSDPDPGDPAGIAVAGLTESGSGRWEFSTDDGDTWQDLEAASSSAARLLAAEDRVRFVPDPGYLGRPALTFHAWDGTAGARGETAGLGATGIGSAFSTAADTAPLRVAPVVARLNEDARTGGTRVSAYTTSFVTDPDARARRGVAVVGAGGDLPGVWQFSTTGGRTWLPLTPDSARARLLRETDRVRFVPARDATGDAYLKVAAWDQSVGAAGAAFDLRPPTIVGGVAAFSDTTDYFVFRVNPVNDPPVLDAKTTAALTQVDPAGSPGAGDRVGTLLGATVTDADGVTAPGLAVTRVSKGGSWQYQLDGAGPWQPVPPVSGRAALLLGPDDRVRFLPDAGFAGTATLTYKAWDRTAGTAGTVTGTARNTAFSTASESATVTISADVPPANQGPVLDPVGVAALADVAEGSQPAGATVAALLGPAVVDPDAGALRGIAVTAVTGTGGAWQFSTNGRTWLPFGPVGRGRALLLRETDRVRFLPAGDWFGPATVTFHAWDQTRGTPGQRADLRPAGATGGATPFSAAAATTRLTVTPTNDAPVLAVRKGVALTTIRPSETNSPGNAVADLIGSRVSDVDPGAVAGIAVTRVTGGSGAWQFSLDGGTTWGPVVPTGPGVALLLRPQDRLRFVPLTGTRAAAAVTYRAWDQTAGTPGTWAPVAGNSAVGRAAETATLAVTDQNVRPFLDTVPVPRLDPVAVGDAAPPGTAVARLLGGVTDPDAGAVTGIAVTGADSANGVWQYTIDGGATWAALPTVSARFALILRATDQVRFVPAAGFAGTARLLFKAWDQSADGDAWAGLIAPTTSPSFSAATEAAVVSVNTAPTLV